MSAEIELHLSTCEGCSARLAALQDLFLEIESLPELELSRDLAASLVPEPNLSVALARSLTLTVTSASRAGCAGDPRRGAVRDAIPVALCIRQPRGLFRRATSATSKPMDGMARSAFHIPVPRDSRNPCS